jgi:GT2 family glycosyltransferase
MPGVEVSVVVATHNRADRLARLVAALEHQRGVAGLVEVVIVDDASTDGTWPELQRLATAAAGVEVRPIRLDRNQGPAVARNAGWRAARGPVVAFTDDDCVPARGWLAALLGRLDRAGAGVVQGQTVPDPDGMAPVHPFAHTVEVTAEWGWYETCNIAYRRELLEALGGFDERFRLPWGEDTDLAWRARESGARIAFEPAAVVLHDVQPGTVLDQVRATRRREGVVIAIARHPQLRANLHQRVFLRPAHLPALVAAAGVVVAARSRLAGAALAVPYCYVRTFGRDPIRARRRHWPVAVPAMLVVDLAEIAMLARASWRQRVVVL